MKRLLLLMSLLVTVVVAQPGPGMGMGGPQRAMEMIRTMRLVRMRERLNLSDAQVASLLPKLSKQDSIMTNFHNSQAEDFKLLKEELAKRTPSEAKLSQIINRMKAKEKENHEQMMAIRDEIMSELSVVQQAQFLVFEVEFEREIRRLIDQVREGHRMEGD